MLVVPHFVGPSLIHGVGLFTEADIPKRTKVYEFDPTFLMTILLERMELYPIGMQQEFYRYGYKGRGLYRLKHGIYVPLDDTRYLNHAEMPNLDTIQSSPAVCYNLCSVRDIKAGEELTIHYRLRTEEGDCDFVGYGTDKPILGTLSMQTGL